MSALSGEQFGAYAHEQIAAAEQILARHYLMRRDDCSCGRPQPCLVARSCVQTRDHYRARIALLERTTALPRVRAAPSRWRRLVMALLSGPALLAAGPKATPELALRVELTFLALRVAQLRHVDVVLAAGCAVVADWALLKQPIFAATTLDAADTALMAATGEMRAPALPTPDLLIALAASTAVLHRRIRRAAGTWKPA